MPFSTELTSLDIFKIHYHYTTDNWYTSQCKP